MPPTTTTTTTTTTATPMAAGNIFSALFEGIITAISLVIEFLTFGTVVLKEGVERKVRIAGILLAILITGWLISVLYGHVDASHIFAFAISVFALIIFQIANGFKRLVASKLHPQWFRPAYGLGLLAMLVPFIHIIWITIPGSFSGTGRTILWLIVFLMIIWWIWGGMTISNPLTVPRAVRTIATILALMFIIHTLAPKVFPTQTRIAVGWVDYSDTRQNIYAANVEEAARVVDTVTIADMPLFIRTVDPKGNEIWDYAYAQDQNGSSVEFVVPKGHAIRVKNPKVPLYNANGEQMMEALMLDKYGLSVKSKVTYYAPCKLTTICGENLKENKDSSITAITTTNANLGTRVDGSNECCVKSGIHVKAGDKVKASVTGSVKWDPNLPSVDYRGTSYPCSTMARSSDFPAQSAGCGALLIKIGGVTYQPSETGFTVKQGGEIVYEINDRRGAPRRDNSGAFFVNTEVVK